MSEIPAELQSLRRWVLWRREQRKGRKATKVPYQVNGRRAKSTDPATWSSYEEARAAFEQGGYDGIGIMLGELGDGRWLVGGDLDLCRSPISGKLMPWAVEVCTAIPTYAEVSPSQTEVKLFGFVTREPNVPVKEITVVAATPEGAEGGDHDTPELCLYPGLRFFAVTGQHLPGSPAEVRVVDNGVAWLIAKLATTKRAKAKASTKPRCEPPPDISPEEPAADGLPARFQKLLAKDRKLQGAWQNGEKLGAGGDTSASGLEASLAIYLSRHLDDVELATVLSRFPHGQVGSGKLGDHTAAERRIQRLLEMAQEARESPEAEFDLAHDALALEMGQQWKDDARHVSPWGKWYFWNGARWEDDQKLWHLTGTRDFLRAKAEEIRLWAERKAEELEATGDQKDQTQADKLRAWAKDKSVMLRSAPMVTNISGLVRSNSELVGTVAQWDADPWRLGTPAGTLDLRTGLLLPANHNDYITKLTAVTPAPEGTDAPLWRAFLARIFKHDPELISYMQRVAGYALTGLINEHVVVFAWGQGGNGKGVFLNTLTGVLGEYAAVAPADLFLETKSDRHPCDLAMFRGARLVAAQELAPGRGWDEPKLKSLSGGDPITARFMRQDFFTYLPQFTLIVAGNHKPSFRGVDEAIRRRVAMVPFLQNIPKEERDPELPEKLKAEWPAILRWGVDGCLEWQRIGLQPPASVLGASEEYLGAEDVLGQWLGECCLQGRWIEFTPTRDLYASWCWWGEETGAPKWSMKAFSQALGERGFTSKKKNTAMGFMGIGPNQMEAFKLAGRTSRRDEMASAVAEGVAKALRPDEPMDFNSGNRSRGWEGRL